MDLVLGARLVMVVEDSVDRDNHVPRLVKIIILVQAAVILSFTIGMYQEYVGNSYLQQYVISLFSSNIVADALLSMVTVSVFALGTFTILGSMSSTRKMKEWKDSSEGTKEAMDIPVMPSLETVDPALKARKATRPRQRRTRLDNDALFRSMSQYADEHTQRQGTVIRKGPRSST
jgi:hypothetical protein